MLNADISIQTVDYERTLDTLFPLFMEIVDGMDANNPLIRLLQKLGRSSQRVVTGILRRLSPRSKNQLLCALIGRYRVEICQKLNALIAESELGRGITVSYLDLRLSDEQMLLALNGINVHYEELLKNEKMRRMLLDMAGISGFGRLSGFSLGMAMNLFHNWIERKGIKILEKTFLPEQLGEMTSRFLKEKKIYCEIGDVVLCTAERAGTPGGEGKVFDQELEQSIIDAVAAYLKDCEA